MTEKRSPHHRLGDVQALVATLGVIAFTKTAIDGGRAMGLTSTEMLAVVAGLTRANFYKSMTSYADHTIWQDVYHAVAPNGRTAYIKLILRPSGPVIQFKER